MKRWKLWACIWCIIPFMAQAQNPLTVTSVQLMPNTPFLNVHTPNDNNNISIGFTGQNLRIYGTTNVRGNIIITIQGKDTTYSLNKKTRKSIFWLDKNVVKTIEAPQFYAINTLYSLRNNAHKQYPFAHIGINNIQYKINDIAPTFSLSESFIWRKFTHLKQHNNSYQYNPAGVKMISPYMFETYIRIPSDMSPGMYYLTAFVDDAPSHAYMPSQIVAVDEKSIYIGRSPLIKFIYTSARDYSSLYGIIAILCSLCIGLGVGFIQRRR